MNDIFHERHMNNIIAADREQNIHGAPDSLDAHRPDNRSGPKAIRQRSLARAVGVGVRCVQAGAI